MGIPYGFKVTLVCCKWLGERASDRGRRWEDMKAEEGWGERKKEETHG